MDKMAVRQGIIYLVTCPEGKSYVGKTVQKLDRRVSQHKKSSSECRAIRDAFSTHGNSMKVSILMRCAEEDLDKNETLYIETLDTVHPRGYNLRCGSHAARPVSDNALSTFVHEPVVYSDADDMAATVKAVVQDVGDLKEGGSLSWSGPIKMSVEALNFHNGAKQFLPWAGPVMGVPVKASLTLERCGTEFVNELRRDEAAKLTVREQYSLEDIKTQEACKMAHMRCLAEQEKKNYELEVSKAQKAADLEIMETQEACKMADAREASYFHQALSRLHAFQQAGMHDQAEFIKKQMATRAGM